MVIQSVRSNGGGICNLVLFMGLFAMSVSPVGAIPIQTSGYGSPSIKYPINIACECIFTLYVDGVYVGEGNKENYDPVNWPFGRSEWNNTKKYYPVIYENEPKIVAFNGIGGQYTVFPNGFIMDMNDGKDYTEYKEWKCKDFSKTVEKAPPANWFTYDYDDSGWDISTSYGANYQNNSFQIFESPRDSISLNAEWLWTKDNADVNIYCRKKNMDTVVLTSEPIVATTIAALPVTTSAPVVTTSAPLVKTTVAPLVTSVSPPLVTTTITHPPATTIVTHPPAITTAPVSTTIHQHMRTHPHITSTTVLPPVITTVTPLLTSAPVIKTTVTHPPATTTTAPLVTYPPVTTSAPVSTTIHHHVRTHPPVTTSAPVSTTIHHHMLTHPPAMTTVTHPPMTTTVTPLVTSVPATTTVAPLVTSVPVVKTTVAHPPVTTTVTHPPMTTTVTPLVTSVPVIKTTIAHTPVSTTIHHHMRTHPHITSTAVPPPATTTVAPLVTSVPVVKTTVAHPPVSTTIHHQMRTHPHITSTAVPPPATTTVAPLVTHLPVTTSAPVSPTIHPIPRINIKIVINNIKYSQGISDKQLAHLLENIKFYNHPQYQSKYRNDHLDNNNLYRTVINARLDLIHHYEILLRHLERLERLERLEHESRDEDTDYKIPRHSSDDSTSKSNIIQSMINLNSRIKHIEDSIHFIKGNHKYLLLHILKNLKQQYKKDTMKIFNI